MSNPLPSGSLSSVWIPSNQAAYLWPYLALYYAGVLALVGYTFGLGIVHGFVTLGTYFLCLGATWYSYAKVGHGEAKTSD